MGRVVVIALFWLLGMSAASAKIESVRIYDPRPIGYFAGDILERTFEIESSGGERIMPSSLPRQGLVTYWLEVRDVKTSSSMNGSRALHRVTLIYQTFYVSLDARKLMVPAVNVVLEGPQGTESVEVPAFTFTSSPLRVLFPEKTGETAETFLRPDPDVRTISFVAERRRLIGWLGATFVVLGLLLHQMGWWPFHHRRSRPFTNSHRGVVRIFESGDGGAQGYQDALLLMHRAFDETAGVRVLASDVDAFLERFGQYRTSRLAIDNLFEASRTAFFGGDARAAQAAFGAPMLLDLSRALAVAERETR